MTEIIFWCENQAVFAYIHYSSVFGMISECFLSLFKKKQKKTLGFFSFCIYCGGKSKRQTQWVWRQASERLLFNRDNKNKMSKGENSV